MPPSKTKAALPAKRTILIVDDHPMLRLGLSALIDGEPDFTVWGQAPSCQAALQSLASGARAGRGKPDLAIIDLGLTGSEGLELIKEIKAHHPEILTLVLSMHNESVYAERAFVAGARGYVSKQELDDTVLIAIRRVFGGGMHMSPRMEACFAAKYISNGALKDDSPLAVLTDRELEVFRLIGQGHSTRQIADRTHRSIKTIESHREHIKQKLTLETAAALVQRATHWVNTGEAI